MARAEEDYWESEAEGWMGTAVQWFSPAELKGPSATNLEPQNAALNLHWLLSEPLALQRRVIKSIGDQAGVTLEFKHVEEILAFAAHEPCSSMQLTLPLGWKALREDELLIFEAPDASSQAVPDYEYRLVVPGQLSIPELRSVIEVSNVTVAGEAPSYNPDQLFDATLLGKELTIRNWRPGDRFWPAHTKSPKKIKELLHERHITGARRKLWPVIASGDEIIWVRGFAVPARLQPGPHATQMMMIRELSPE